MSNKAARITIEVTPAALKRLALEWSQIAGEPIRVENISGAIYGFGGTELGALRLERKYRYSTRARALESPAYGWTFRLEI